MANADVEAKVFNRFAAITANFAGGPVACAPGNNPPDILCTHEEGRIGVELSEWIDEAQIANEKPQYQREEEFLEIIDSKRETPPTHIGRIIFFEQEGIRLQQRDSQRFRQELYAFINDVDQRWETFEGHDERPGIDFDQEDFAAYPTLAKYSHSLECTAQQHDPSRLGDEWIMFMAHGGAYTPDDALEAAIASLKKKTSKYATLKDDEQLDELYLLLYYDQGWACNTPYRTPTFGFSDIADALRLAATNDHGQFDKIFLFIPETDDVAQVYP